MHYFRRFHRTYSTAFSGTHAEKATFPFGRDSVNANHDVAARYYIALCRPPAHRGPAPYVCPSPSCRPPRVPRMSVACRRATGPRPGEPSARHPTCRKHTAGSARPADRRFPGAPPPGPMRPPLAPDFAADRSSAPGPVAAFAAVMAPSRGMFTTRTTVRPSRRVRRRGRGRPTGRAVPHQPGAGGQDAGRPAAARLAVQRSAANAGSDIWRGASTGAFPAKYRPG